MSFRRLCCVLVLGACPLSLCAQTSSPALVVLLAIDQMRADRLSAQLSGGLGELYRQGRSFINATLDHGITTTCAGHSVMLTGQNPNRNGVPGNRYIDSNRWQERYCVDDLDPAVRVIGGQELRSPRILQASTLGDWMKQANPNSLVYALAAKDRAAITLGGRQADGVFWLDLTTGWFTSSGFYMRTLPDWLSSYNGDDILEDGYLGRLPRDWRHHLNPYRPDNYAAEDDRFERAGPHPLAQGDLEDRIEQFYVSPAVDESVLELAQQLILQSNLGLDDTPDLLALSLAATDTVGHAYGPFSAEAHAVLQVIDRKLPELLQTIDKRTNGNYLLVLTADHGALALPEWKQEQGRSVCPVPGGRVDAIDLFVGLLWETYKEFTFPFGWPRDLIDSNGAQVYVNRKYAAQHDIDPARVLRFVEQQLETEPVIEEVWTRTELAASDSEFARLYRQSLVDGLSGDLIIQPKQDCYVGLEHGTGHGTPYSYDRQIPLVFYGQGITGGIDERPSHSVDIAPTLARRLGLPVPAGLDGKILPLN